MKRKLTALLLVLLLAVTLAVPALAAGDWVTDEAGLLTDQQISQLSQRAAALAQSSGIGVYIRTVDDYADYGFTDVETASYTLYHNDSLGVGDGRDGVLLLLSVSKNLPCVIPKAQPLATKEPYGCGFSACRSERSDVGISCEMFRIRLNLSKFQNNSARLPRVHVPSQ